MTRAGALLLLALAPFQCPSDPDPGKLREDTPGEALYELSVRFAKDGDREAQIRTLKFILDRYPRSRFSTTAESELRALGVPVAAPTVAPDPKNEGAPVLSATSVPSANTP